MNWEAIGAVGEVGGAVAVVATLAFLARQIRSGTNASAAAATWQASQAMAELHGRALGTHVQLERRNLGALS